LIFILLLGLSACKKIDFVNNINDAGNAGTGLTGIWNNDVKYGDNINRSSYQFNTDSTVILTQSVLNSIYNTLGYTYQLKAKYSLNGSSLRLYALTAYGIQNNSAPYTALKNLVPMPTSSQSTVNIQFSEDKSSFTLIYPSCPANANCIGSSGPYIKQQ